MWPWEHLAVGYLAYSLLVHVFERRAPRGWPVIAMAIGTQFPDLVDKPLAWTFGILPTGHTLAHSLFVALPVSALAVTAAWALGRASVGSAFALGYLSHLPADVYYPALVGGEPSYGFLFWPLVPAPGSETSIGFVTMIQQLFNRFVTELTHSTLSVYVGVEFGLMVGVLLLWVYDGMPPLQSLRSAFDLEPAEKSP